MIRRPQLAICLRKRNPKASPVDVLVLGWPASRVTGDRRHQLNVRRTEPDRGIQLRHTVMVSIRVRWNVVHVDTLLLRLGT